MSVRAVSRLAVIQRQSRQQARGVHANHHKVLLEQALKSDSLRKVLLTQASR